MARTSAEHSRRSSRVVAKRRPLGTAPRQWPARPMRCKAIVDFVPHFVGSHRAKLAGGNFDGQVELTPMTYLHDHGIGATRAGEKMGHEFDGLLRGRKANAREVPAGQMVETFE